MLLDVGPSLLDDRCDSFGSFRLHARKHVCVLGERKGGVLVAEAFADHFDRHPGAEREGRVSVSEIMEPDASESAAPDFALEDLRQPVRMDGSTVGS